MEGIINIHIEKLPEGVYLATSDEIQGLVAQGRTVAEVIEIARDVAKKLIESHTEEKSSSVNKIRVQSLSESFDYPLILGT
jgi:predicted RNase H-like HicB family nuclease